VVIPDRVSAGLLDAVTRTELQTVVVIHCNHANEIDNEVEQALARLTRRGITLLNQSVLLAGINDSTDALTALSERLFAAGVLPYYLHLLDKVQGAAHFDVPEERARHLISGISAVLPGYLVPKLAREMAGAPSKLVLGGIW
jgi:KamA family protein